MEKLLKASADRNAKQNSTEAIKQGWLWRDGFAKLQEYAKSGYESIDEDDKKFLLKNFGIFDRPATPQLFMLRVRIPAGQLSALQAKTIGELAFEFGRDYIDLTTRMQLQLRYLSIESLPTVLERLDAVGITTFQTGVDNFRNIVSDPLDGVSHDCVIDTAPIVEELQGLFLRQEEWICALPRKFNVGISGSYSNRCNLYGQDLSFALAQKDGVHGFNVYMGGKVGALSHGADVFVQTSEVLPFFDALARVFRDYGFRDNRNKNRLKFMIDAVGMGEIVDAVKQTARREFAAEGRTLAFDHGGEDGGRVQLRDGSFALHSVVPAGVFSGSAMIEAAKTAQEFGNGEIRLTVEQNLYILGVAQQKTTDALTSRYFEWFKNSHSSYHTNLIACAGVEHCPFGVIPNKPDAIEMADYLAQKLPASVGKLRMYWSACPKGCGIHGAGDIGFLGGKAHRDGKTILAVDIFLGGKVGDEGAEGKLVVKSAVLNEAKYLVEALLKEYIANRKPLESFEEFYDRFLSRFSRYCVGFLMQFNAMFEGRLSLHLASSFEKNELAELYDFGVQLYRKLTGKEPFEDTNILFLFGKKSPLLNKSDFKDEGLRFLAPVITKMIEPDALKRYQAFSEVYADIQSIIKEETK